MQLQPLAIVIPAYKLKFFELTLASIAAQTDRRFKIYVGDDGSPEDLRAVCDRWANRLDLQYVRFERNLGATNLVGQWHRCIDLSIEPWVWLFGDDDVMPPDAVATVLPRLLAASPADCLFHFDVELIDAAGLPIRAVPSFPAWLSSRKFALARMHSTLASYAPEYVFSRMAFERAGRFQTFPRAWCADDAMWVALAAHGGIQSFARPRVQWRYSGSNISSRHDSDRSEKVLAAAQFIRWLDGFLRQNPARGDDPQDTEILQAARFWFHQQVRTLGVSMLDPALWRALSMLSQVRGVALGRLVAGVIVRGLAEQRAPAQALMRDDTAPGP